MIPSLFKFTPGDRILLKEIVKLVRETIDTKGAQYFCTVDDVQQKEDEEKEAEKGKVAASKTHFFLNKLVKAADQNLKRPKAGYRYAEDVKYFSSYIRMIAGPLAYETLQRNLEGALPSLPSTNRYIKSSNHFVGEGILRHNELLLYLTERNLPLWVSLSEDQTRIVNRVQYDSNTNQIIGFVLPIDKNNGMPVPFTYEARSAEEIVKYFTQNVPVATLVNVVMAQPLSTIYPAFCLLIFGSDNKYSRLDVRNRWKFIVAELKKLKINVLTISTDSDPKYNSTMRSLSMLGHETHMKWFSCAVDQYSFPYYIQDPTHIGTKLKAMLLKTVDNETKLPFGSDYIKESDIRYLLDNFSRDKHCLTESTLNPADKMNFEAVLRICDQRVIDLLRSSVAGSRATVKFLEIVKNIIDSFMDANLKPLERIQKIWYSVFVLRIWRNFVVTSDKFNTSENFLTANCYSCIELNAHSMVLCMLYLKEKNMPEIFLPFLMESQPCEKIFRQIRSFTSTYSTVANCSVKEIVNRISKIQLQNEITHDCSSFSFPRLGKKKNSVFTVPELPTKEEIIQEIEKAKMCAQLDAVKIGLVRIKDLKTFDFSCKINIIQESEAKIRSQKEKKSAPELQQFTNNLYQLKGITLQNFAGKFKNKTIDERSSFVEIFANQRKRIVVKKSSLCWMLRKDWTKLSSDRLLRVQTNVEGQKRKKTKNIAIYKNFNKPKKTRK